MRILICPVLLLLTQLVLITPLHLSGQGRVADVIPARAQDYSTLGTFPTACFDSAWTDSTGRLLIMTCPPEAADGMHIFAFDGYEFRIIQYPLDSLPANSKILTRVGDHTVIGRSGNSSAFVANILTGEIRCKLAVQVHRFCNLLVNILS